MLVLDTTALMSVVNIGDAWRSASRSIDRLDARLLVEHVAACTHADLIADPTRPLSAEQLAALDALVMRCAGGEPLAYLLGCAGFYGREFLVTPAVLVPRPETELLVDVTAELYKQAVGLRIVDLGTGSGVVAVTIARLFSRAVVTAVDISLAALAVARANAGRHAAEVNFLAGDWYAPLGDDRFNLIAANPPYIAQGDSHLQQGGLPFEPLLALTDGVSGGDGLACLRAIIGGAPAHLFPDGWLLVEHGYNQAVEVRAMLQGEGFSDVASWRDLSRIERVSGGRWR